MAVKNKNIYKITFSDCDLCYILMLSEEQVRVFQFLKDNGWDLGIEMIDKIQEI